MKAVARGPRSLPPGWQRALVAAATGALLVASTAALAVWGPMVLAEAQVLGALGLLLAWLLRPWSLLMRWLQPLSPRFAAMALLAPTPLVLGQRDALVQALAWASAGCLALALAGWLPASLAPLLVGTPLEGMAWVLMAAVAVLVLSTLGPWLHGLPARWARARLAGRRDGAATSDALALAANLMLLLPVAWAGLALVAQATESTGAARALLVLAPAAMAGWALHAGLRHWLAGKPPQQAALWLVVLPTDPAHPPAAAASGPDAVPPETHTLLALAHQLAGRWQLGPVTVLLPDHLAASGEHLHAAQAAGRGGALFPTLPVQLADWQQTLPPPARWAALPLRTLHLPRRWMAGAATLLLQPGDRLLVLAPADAELAAWQALLHGRPGRVLRLGLAGARAGDADAGAAGPTVAIGERKTPALAAAALALLQPLRPQADAGGTATGLQGGAAAAAESVLPASAPAALGLPAVPGLARPAAFAALSALLLLMGFVTLRLELAASADAVAGAYAALRWQALSPAAGSAAAAPQTLALQGLLATDITNGLLTVADRPGQSVVSLRSDGLFDSGSAALSAGAEPALARVAEALARSAGNILVTGHTDNQPVRSLRYPSNWHLSEERAQAVLTRLAERMDRARLRAEGRADTEPLADNATPAGRAANRRIEIVVLQPAGAAMLPAPVPAASADAPDAAGANNRGNRAAPVPPPAAPASQAAARMKKS